MALPSLFLLAMVKKNIKIDYDSVSSIRFAPNFYCVGPGD